MTGLIAILVGFVIILIATFSDRKLNGKRVLIEISKDKEIILEFKGYSKEEKKEIKKIINFDLIQITEKVTNYEDTKREKERQTKIDFSIKEEINRY